MLEGLLSSETRLATVNALAVQRHWRGFLDPCRRLDYTHLLHLWPVLLKGLEESLLRDESLLDEIMRPSQLSLNFSLLRNGSLSNLRRSGGGILVSIGWRLFTHNIFILNNYKHSKIISTTIDWGRG